MRAVCEKCGAAQPPDWKAGDLCGTCGAAVRRDVRCFWCAKGTPFAKFCRSCGAELVDERLYGAARMLKDAGTDRFTVPKMLRELDPDQLENFTRIYQRHAAAVARQVDDLRFLERFLFHRHWSAALEDELIPQLPFSEQNLKALTLAPLPAGDDLATVKAIQEATTLGRTRLLASLARVRLDDWDALKEARKAWHDQELCPEAALVLTGWRLDAAGHSFWDDNLQGWLEASGHRLEAGVRLGLRGKGDPELLKEALESPDAEISFTAALALGDAERLSAALGGDELQKAAAGRRLAALGAMAPLARALSEGSLEVQHEILDGLIRQKRAVPELRTTLFRIVDTTRFEDAASVEKRIFVEGDRVRWEILMKSLRLLTRECPPEDALRIARAGRGEREIFRCLLVDEAALPPDAVGAVLGHMVEIGKFSHDQWGLDAALKRGAVPDDFVLRKFPAASDPMRRDLVRLAEKQLEKAELEPLHRFVMNAVFGPHPAETRAAAWWALHRVYRRDDHRGEGPFRLEEASLRRFFGSTREFLLRATDVLRDDATLKEVGLYEFLARLFKEADPGLLPALVAEEAAARELVRATIDAIQGPYWAYLIDGMIDFLGLVGVHPPWRDEVIAGLTKLDRKGNYHWDKALEKLRLSVHGIPPESEWAALPDTFVGGRFAAATPEGRRELLRVAEQQFIHATPEALPTALLKIAFGPYDAATRIEALGLVDERAPRERRRFPLKPRPISAVFGSLADFLPGLVAALRDPTILKDRTFLDFLHDLLRERDARAVVAEEAGDLVQALLDLAAKPGDGGNYYNLRMETIRFLGELGDDPRWRERVLSALGKLREDPAFDLRSECERAMRLIAPPLPEPQPRDLHVPRPVRPIPAPPPVENPWAAKQQEAERLGKELQETAMKISFGSGTPEEKTRQIMQLQEEFQAKIKALYGM